MILSLAGCSKYSPKYKAVGFVHSNDSSSAYMNFYSFEGRMVFRLNSPGEGAVKYSAKLESGTATVYYDYLGTSRTAEASAAFTASGRYSSSIIGTAVSAGEKLAAVLILSAESLG